MIKLTDINGRAVYLHPDAIAEVSEVGPAQAWHGVRANVRTFDRRHFEVRETPEEIVAAAAASGEARRGP